MCGGPGWDTEHPGETRIGGGLSDLEEVFVEGFKDHEVPCVFLLRFLNISNTKVCIFVVVPNSHEGSIEMSRKFDNRQHCQVCIWAKAWVYLWQRSDR